MELQRLNQNEESDKRKRGIALKASSSFQEDIDNEDSNDEEDFSLFVKRFHKFIKTRRNQRPHKTFKKTPKMSESSKKRKGVLTSSAATRTQSHRASRA